jgi:hypothetical protein
VPLVPFTLVLSGMAWFFFNARIYYICDKKESYNPLTKKRKGGGNRAFKPCLVYGAQQGSGRPGDIWKGNENRPSEPAYLDN